MQIQAATLDDWPQIRRIYVAGIRTGLATFAREDDIPDGPSWFAAKRTDSVIKAVHADGTVAGWAALAPVSKRTVYAGVAEVSIYIAEADRGRGIGRQLLTVLIERSERDNVWTLQAGIFPENRTSIDLHKRCGFRILGVREKLGKLDGEWRDVVLMERRSPVVW